MSARAEAEARLRAAEWLRRPPTQRIFALLDARRTRAVGGIVRDTLLGRPHDTAEIDLATELLPGEVMQRAAEAGIAAHPTGIDHGTVTLALEETVAEVTTLREDVETFGRHARVRFGTHWERDAERRDFTLNGLYADADGALFDPLGGLDDCLSGRVRFIGDPDRRIAEDRLRVYRFFRFSASHGGEHLDPAGLDACRRVALHLGRLSAERVGGEMRRMLALPRVALTLQAMALTGVLALGTEPLRLLTAYEQRVPAPTLAGRLAIIIAGSDGQAVQRQWRLSNAEVAAAGRILSAERLLEGGKLNEAAYRHPEALADAIALATILHHSGPLHPPGAVPKFPISGRDLVRRGYRPGPELGRELLRLEQAWIDSGFALDRKSLLAAVRPD